MEFTWLDERPPPVEEIELTDEQKAESKFEAVTLTEQVQFGDGAEPALQNPHEALMSGSVVSAAEESVAVEKQLADEDVVITVSHEGFVKRMPMHLYRRRVSSGKGLAITGTSPQMSISRPSTVEAKIGADVGLSPRT